MRGNPLEDRGLVVADRAVAGVKATRACAARSNTRHARESFRGSAESAGQLGHTRLSTRARLYWSIAKPSQALSEIIVECGCRSDPQRVLDRRVRRDPRRVQHGGAADLPYLLAIAGKCVVAIGGHRERGHLAACPSGRQCAVVQDAHRHDTRKPRRGPPAIFVRP